MDRVVTVGHTILDLRVVAPQQVAQATATVSVIICAYSNERWYHLLTAVNSVRQQTYRPLEIVLVIDHNDALFEHASEELSGILVIENMYERGLSGARNTGVALAKGTMLAFLDDDAVASPDWLEHLARAAREPNVLGVGGMIAPDWERDAPRWFPEEFQWVVGCCYRGMPEKRVPIRNPIGANMLVKRDVFEAVGGFREGIGRVGTLPIGCEETELCIRAHKHWSQHSFLYEPQASVMHYVPTKRATWRYFLARCYAEGRSKAAISRFVGSQDALSSERGYVLRTLPLGILRGMGQTLLAFVSCSQSPLTGIKRVAAIVMGLAATAVGYVGK